MLVSGDFDLPGRNEEQPPPGFADLGYGVSSAEAGRVAEARHAVEFGVAEAGKHLGGPGCVSLGGGSFSHGSFLRNWGGEERLNRGHDRLWLLLHQPMAGIGDAERGYIVSRKL